MVIHSTAHAALSAFVDLYLAVYPVAVLWKLNMSMRKKLALSSALGLGAMYVRPLRWLGVGKTDMA